MTESGEWKALLFNMAQILPLEAKNSYTFKVKLKAEKNTSITVVLRTSSRETHFTPDVEIQSKTFDLIEGEQEFVFTSNELITKNSYVYVCFMKNEAVEIMLSDERFSGIMTVLQKETPAVSNYGKQEPPEGIGVDTFDFWTPEKKPAGKNIAMFIEPAIQNFSSINIKNNNVRPTSEGYSNAWLAKLNDEEPQLVLNWSEEQEIRVLRIFFDCDFDNALPSVFVTHPVSEIPATVKEYSIYDGRNNLLYQKRDNYQAVNKVLFDKAILVKKLRIVFTRKNANIPVSVFKISAYSENY
tara:strand:- start:373 stop:1266 length:894 start_codon:yes stop_codon:yes gene_type:complete